MNNDFILEHAPAIAFQIADRYLGKTLMFRGSGILKNRPYYCIGYSQDFSLSHVKAQIRKELDDIGWLFLTTGHKIEYKDGRTIPSFGMAPLIPRSLKIGYHATRSCLIPIICGENGEGLLPSNADRAATDFPDTEDVIHVCEKLTHEGNENDSAEWWKKTLSERNIVGDPHWGIVRIDMTGLPTTARIYQDMHSASGVIVDRIDRIPGRLIEPVSEIEP